MFLVPYYTIVLDYEGLRLDLKTINRIALISTVLCRMASNITKLNKIYINLVFNMILDGRDGAAIKVEAVKGLLPPYVFGNLPVVEYLPPAPYNDI